VRAANYVKTLRRDLLKVSEACGVEHPALINADHVELVDAATAARPLRDVFGYRPEWARPSGADRSSIIDLMTSSGPRGGSRPPSPTAMG
jgi:hypothetical protein